MCLDVALEMIEGVEDVADVEDAVICKEGAVELQVRRSKTEETAELVRSKLEEKAEPEGPRQRIQAKL